MVAPSPAASAWCPGSSYVSSDYEAKASHLAMLETPIRGEAAGQNQPAGGTRDYLGPDEGDIGPACPPRRP